MTKPCIICNTKFHAKGRGRHIYCSTECRAIGYANSRNLVRAKYKKSISVFEDSIEGLDFVTCMICGEKGKRLYGKHFNEKHNGLKKLDYQKIFPGAKVACDKDNEKLNNTRGKWMRLPAHRERQSVAIKGQANPMSKSRKPEIERKQASPFSLEFWKKRFPEESEASLIEMRSAKVKEFLSNRVVSTSLQYYLNMGHTEETAKKLLGDKQTTFSLEKCIKKYGEEGLNKWKTRQDLWKSKVFNKDTHIGRATSKISEAFISFILDKYSGKLLHGKDEKFIQDSAFSRVYKYDLCEPNSKKIIEFNGDYWHCNPIKFNSEYFNKVKQLTASQIWEYDARKREIAEHYLYQYMVVWEADYRSNPKKVIEQCLKFLTT